MKSKIFFRSVLLVSFISISIIHCPSKAPTSPGQVKGSKAVVGKVTLIGKVENREENAVQGIDYSPPKRVGPGVMTDVGKCGWVKMTSPVPTVSRLYIVVIIAKGEDGEELEGLSGQSLRVACDKWEEAKKFTSKEVEVQGFIRLNKKLKSNEIEVVSITEINKHS